MIQKRPRKQRKKSQKHCRRNGQPNSRLPANQKQQAKRQLDEGQCMCDPISSVMRDDFVLLHRWSEIPQVDGYGELQRQRPEKTVSKKNFGIGRKEKDACKD